MTQCFLNGAIMPLTEAKISPLDRGFLFGDGIYEVIPIYDGKMFCRRRHFRRLARNLAEIRIAFDAESLLAPAQRLIDSAAADNAGDLSLYIQITRGASPIRKHAFPVPPPPPTAFMFAAPRAPIANEKIHRGVSCRTMEEFRWLRADIKSSSLLGAVLAAQHAAECGDEEVILIRDGFAGEAAACNIFAVVGGALITPPADRRILPGISREIAMELARRRGIRVFERDIPRAELAAADEIWLSSSTREVLPVTLLDGAPVGDGKPGALFAAVFAAFRRFVQNGEE